MQRRVPLTISCLYFFSLTCSFFCLTVIASTLFTLSVACPELGCFAVVALDWLAPRPLPEAVASALPSPLTSPVATLDFPLDGDVAVTSETDGVLDSRSAVPVTTCGFPADGEVAVASETEGALDSRLIGLCMRLPDDCPVAISRGAAVLLVEVPLVLAWPLALFDCATAIADKHTNPTTKILFFILFSLDV